jgi:hypothetical protein
MSVAGSDIQLNDDRTQQFEQAAQAGKKVQEQGGESKEGEGLTKEEKELATRLASLIEGANNQLVPVCKMIRRVCYSLAFLFTRSHTSLTAYRSNGCSQR